MAISTGVYCPHVVERWLNEWDLLVSLAETPRTSSHHLRPGHAEHTGPCLDSPRNGQGGVSPDPMGWADVLADLAGAMAALPIGSLERRVAYGRAQGGGSLRDLAVILRKRSATVGEAYHAAAVMMAASLGYDSTRPCQCRA